jgi:PAS domain S-box-containing protein
MGVALTSCAGEPLGILNVFHDGPLPAAAQDPTLLQIFASRAAAELERMQMQAALEESERLLRGILESTPDAVLAVDRSGSIEFMNDAANRLFRLPPDACAERSITDLLPALPGAGARQEGPSTLELEAHRADDTTSPVVVTVGELDLGSRQLRSVVVRDISKRIREEQRLRAYARALERTNTDLEQAKLTAEEAARAKTEFLANMSHEIRTPMTAILGFAEVLLERETEGDTPSDRRDALRTILRNGAYLLEILNDVLDFSKIEANRLDVERIPCSPLRLLFELDSLLRVRAEQKGIALEFALDGEIPESIESDPVRLRQIILNLVGNALKFTEQGSVRVVARYLPDELEVEFEVTDTGVGIPLDKLADIFDPFSQADSSTTRRFGGTGLGLAISKRLVDLLGGSIEARSRSGEGSEFRFRVPIGTLQGVAMVDELKDPETDSGQRLRERIKDTQVRGRILVVEDGRDNQRLIQHILEAAGCTVRLADNGQAGHDLALAACDAEEPFDIVLMDLQMPVLDGYEATRQLRANGYAGPIIALTAHALPAERQRCTAAGCDDFATKPINRFELLTLIKRYLPSHKRELD